MDVSTIIQKLDQSKIPNVTPGKAKNIDEFFEMIIRPQFENATVINCIHHELLEYINLSAPTFFIRAHGSYSRDKYEFLRRGFLTRYSNGVEYAFCDNTFALLFATMRFSDQAIEAGDILRELKNTNIPFIMSPNFTKRRHDHEDINCDSKRNYPGSDRIDRSIG